MSRKSVLLTVGLILLLAGSIVTVLAVLVRHEPAFYAQAAVPDGAARRQLSAAFKTEFVQLLEGLVNHRAWYARFTEDQVNSYFAEDFLRERTVDKILPEGVSTPRVALEADRIRLGFRCGSGVWSSVVSVDLRVWLTAQEPNVVALEVQGLHAGALPVISQWVLDPIDRLAKQQNVDITWYRHHGNPVGVLRFQNEQLHPTVHLQRLELHPGTLLLSGCAVEAVLGADAREP